jgi:hypothetical protein
MMAPAGDAGESVTLDMQATEPMTQLAATSGYPRWPDWSFWPPGICRVPGPFGTD